MFSKFASFAAAALVVASLTAPAHAYRADQGISVNGTFLNGLKTNGLKANGLRTNGSAQDAAPFAIDGIELPGAPR